MAITVVFPILVNILANQWLFGNSFCNLTPYVSTYCSTAGILLISVMTMSKVLLIKYPLRFGSVSSKKEGYKLCASCWLVAVIMPATMLFTDSRNVYFSYRSYQCDYDFSPEIWRSLLPVLSAVFLFIPTCLKWQGIMTTVLTATMFCVSILPYFVYNLGGSVLSSDITNSDTFKIKVYRVAYSFLSLNTM